MTQRALTSSEQLLSAAQAGDPVSFRQAPHNIEAEQLLLGAILVNNDVMDRISSGVFNRNVAILCEYIELIDWLEK